jgi:hypothetical protein
MHVSRGAIPIYRDGVTMKIFALRHGEVAAPRSGLARLSVTRTFHFCNLSHQAASNANQMTAKQTRNDKPSGG